MKKVIVNDRPVFQCSSELDWNSENYTIAILRDIELKSKSDIEELENTLKFVYPDLIVKYVDTFTYDGEDIHVILFKNCSVNHPDPKGSRLPVQSNYCLKYLQAIPIIPTVLWQFKRMIVLHLRY